MPTYLSKVQSLPPKLIKQGVPKLKQGIYNDMKRGFHPMKPTEVKQPSVLAIKAQNLGISVSELLQRIFKRYGL